MTFVFSRRWALALLVASPLVAAFGCFQAPDISKVTCTNNANCPHGYVCARPGVAGGCVKIENAPDVSGADTFVAPDSAPVLDGARVADGGVPLDLGVVGIDGPGESIDQPSDKPVDVPAVGIDATDSPLPDTAPDSTPLGLDLRPVDLTLADTPPDAPILTPDAGPACGGGCCTSADCPGACQTCSSSHTCVALLNADDPTGRCAGTCDATGTCKSKKGQTCQTVASGCTSGTTCSPDGICCDQACTSSCMACDISGFVGTCTPVASGSPHGNRTSCAATPAACSGTCAGRSDGQCSYPTTACGAASCTSTTTYQPAGACSAGTCITPATQSCPSGQTCSGTACACLAPNSACSSGCVNTQTDPANCGSCGHGCQGGTCSAGQCQPIVMTSSLGGYSFAFGVDSQYVYYNNCSDFYTCTPLRIAIGAVGGTGTSLTSVTCSGFGVIGSTLLLFENQVANFLCTIGSTCAPTTTTRLGNGIFAGFKSPTPTYFALSDYSNSTTEITTWYTATNAVQSTFSWSHQATVSSFAAVGNSVYWIEDVSDTGGTTIGHSVSGTVGFPASAVNQLAGGMPANNMIILDANSKSLIIQDSTTNYLYRVPLPSGVGTAAPQQIAGATATRFVTEDANGIYWIDTLGNLNRCAAPNCTTSTPIATGQPLGNYSSADATLGPLYQDATSLYWINGLGQLIKLAK